MKEKAFTLVEVIMSLGIFALISMSLLSLFKFNIDIYNHNLLEQSVIDYGEEALNEVLDEIGRLQDTDLDADMLKTISNKYSDPELYEIEVSPLDKESLYLVELNYKESRVKGLCCVIYHPK